LRSIASELNSLTRASVLSYNEISVSLLATCNCLADAWMIFRRGNQSPPDAA